MIYSQSGRYAIRAMVHIAQQSDRPERVRAAEIASAESIPPSYLAKILQDLTRHRLLSSTRGRNGGFRLGMPAEAITAIQVIAAVEDIRRLKEECVLGLESCSDSVPCALHRHWGPFRDRALAILESLTLAEMADEVAVKRGDPAGCTGSPDR